MSYEHPSVYIATYSNIDVYECSVGESPIMRRCKDDWVNATQILKLCNFPKAKRTKILEKGVQQGQHEKVQGGYGRFQGTWIPLQDARLLAKEYGITAELVPVLYVDTNDPAVIIPKKSKPLTQATNKDGTPVKRKYVKKMKKDSPPKKMKFDDNLPPSAVFTQDISHANVRTNSGLHRTMSNMPQMPVTTSTPHSSHLPPTFQQSEFLPNGSFQRGFNYGMPDSYSQSQPQHGYTPTQLQFPKNTFTGVDEISHQQLVFQSNRKNMSQSTNDTNWSEEHQRDSDTSLSSAEHKIANAPMQEENSFASQLLRFFSEDNAPIPYFLYNPPSDFNINEAIDDEGHSTLHWAASIGNLNLVHLVLSKGANPLVVSNFGLNPLSKCISFNNCYDLKNFPSIVDALEVCLINTDINGRTPLHYLCQFSKVRSKLVALNYYLTVIYNKLRGMSGNNKSSGINLLKNVLDHQDVNGDTCLHLAARAGCPELVEFFLTNGARDDLVNANNQTSKALIVQQGLVVYNFETPHISLQQVPPLQQSHSQLSATSQTNATQLNHINNSSHNTSQDHHLQQSNQSQQNQLHQQNIPVVRVSGSPDSDANESAKKQTTATALGTPIRNPSRLMETPDTQRTTIQDEEEDELRDRVSKEHLGTLLQKQTGTVDENKENIFLEDTSKGSYDDFKPAHQHSVLGVISEKPSPFNEEFEHSTASISNDMTPRPPKIGQDGALLREAEDKEIEQQATVLPTNDLSSMMHGMVNSLAKSYKQELKDLMREDERIKKVLSEKKDCREDCFKKVQVLLHKNDFKPVSTLADAGTEVDREVKLFQKAIEHKQTQLLYTIEKLQTYELTNLIHENENKISEFSTNASNAHEQWEMGVKLSKMQLKRSELVKKIAGGVRDFAINTKMNKYRKLISLSCGLRVEDIDGLIDGIEESLIEGKI